MGIVMTIVMLIGLITLFKNNRTPALTIAVALLLKAAGLWNALWYGIQHLDEFWGYAGLLTGIVMLATSIFIWLTQNENQPKPIVKFLIAFALGISFALYFISIVQLNLGYEIIR